MKKINTYFDIVYVLLQRLLWMTSCGTLNNSPLNSCLVTVTVTPMRMWQRDNDGWLMKLYHQILTVWIPFQSPRSSGVWIPWKRMRVQHFVHSVC